MATGDDWSRDEVEAIVADYLSMLESELAGQRFNKAEHRRALARSEPASRSLAHSFIVRASAALSDAASRA